MSNQITVVGNLTREPELRYTPTGAAVVKFGLAVNRFYTNRNGEKVEQTDFFNVNAWRSVAVNVAKKPGVQGNRRVLDTNPRVCFQAEGPKCLGSRSTQRPGRAR